MKKPSANDIYYAVAHRSQKEIDSFKSRYSNFDTSLIPKIFKQALNREVKDFKQSTSWGSSHVIYYVTLSGQPRPTQLILRANLGFNKQPEMVMQIEKLITDKVADLRIPTNRVLYVDTTRKHFSFDFQIQEVLDGKDLEDHFKGTQRDYDSLSFALGRYIATYKTVTLDGFGLFDPAAAQLKKLTGTKKSFFEYIVVRLDSDIQYLVDADVISEKIGKRIIKLFEEYRPIINIKKGSLVHHDLADHNIMFKGKKITGIFDWEAAIIGDPILDLASCPTWKTHYPREEKLLEGYRSITDLPEHFKEKMDIYRLRTMLWKMVFAIRSNILNDIRKKKFNTALEPFML